jgi:hypothetical protein
MKIIKFSDGFIGQIILFALFWINKWFPLEIDYFSPKVFHFLFLVQRSVDFIMWPVYWFIEASIAITQSPPVGILGFLLGVIIVGFIYGIIAGMIIRTIVKLICCCKKKNGDKYTVESGE